MGRLQQLISPLRMIVCLQTVAAERQSMGRFYSLSATSPPFITNYMLSRTELGERLHSLILLQSKLKF